MFDAGDIAVLAVVLAGQFLAYRKVSIGVCVALFFTDVFLLGLVGVLYPFFSPITLASHGKNAVIVLGVFSILYPRFFARLAKGLSKAYFAVPLISLYAVVIPFSAAETVTRFMVQVGVIQTINPLQTVYKGGEDWRQVHILANHLREPDPVLLWRPVPRPPYNSQRLRGPEVAEKSQNSAFRIMTYGDSNTDGPPSGGWPHALRAEFEVAKGKDLVAAEVQVLNAGVTGYSSYQGLLRFRSHVGRFKPDLILVSFGWNDVAPALSNPDKLYLPPSPILAGLQRFFLRYTFYRMLRGSASENGRTAGKPIGSRVSVADYVANMKRFLEISRKNHVVPVFLTRPHREKSADLRKFSGWRSMVPRYNEALLSFCRREGATCLDIQKKFEASGQHLFVDESHFNAQGYKEMAVMLRRYLICVMAKGKRGTTQHGDTGNCISKVKAYDVSRPVVAPKLNMNVSGLTLGPQGRVMLATGHPSQVSNRIKGWVDSVALRGQDIVIIGWAADMGAALPVSLVAVFVEGRLVGTIRPSIPRPDVVASLGKSSLLVSGFRLPFAKADGGLSMKEPVRVFAFDKTGASAELQYSPRYPFRH